VNLITAAMSPGFMDVVIPAKAGVFTCASNIQGIVVDTAKTIVRKCSICCTDKYTATISRIYSIW
jgi:hypothetical protein